MLAEQYKPQLTLNTVSVTIRQGGTNKEDWVAVQTILQVCECVMINLSGNFSYSVFSFQIFWMYCGKIACSANKYLIPETIVSLLPPDYATFEKQLEALQELGGPLLQVDQVQRWATLNSF